MPPTKKPYDGQHFDPMHPREGTPPQEVADFWGDTDALDAFARKHAPRRK